MTDSGEQRLFALRGATSVERNDRDSILGATSELLSELMDRNQVAPEAMVSCVFTTTEDLDAEFPAVAARQLGLNRVPLLCTREMAVPGSLPRCIRVLVHCYGTNTGHQRHVYLGAARKLREDLDDAQ